MKKQNEGLIQIGLWLTKESIEVACWQQFVGVKSLIIPIEQLADIHSILRNWLNLSAADFLNVKRITAISPQKMWYKSIIMPQRLKTNECEQQCEYLLQQELSFIPRQDIWFDFAHSQSKQNTRIDLFAIMKSVAKEEIKKYQPIRIKVMDSALICAFRAAQYIQQKLINNQTLLLYCSKQFSFAVMDRPQGYLIHCNNEQNLLELYQQFCQRFETPEKVIFYSNIDINADEIKPEWEQIKTDFPLIALGCSLWQQELLREEFAHEYKS